VTTADAVINPLWVKGARSRLRPVGLTAFGVVVVSVAAFIYLIVYLVTYERGFLDHEQAAKTALVPLIIMQAVILMVIGTSTVASGFARERAGELLDYHRLTPMSPSSKIVGFLFGLPVREYVLFALTLPFVVYAMVRGGFSLWRLVTFYSVFLTSTWVYHMTGMVAGMCARKPWSAQAMSIGMVAGLYLVLPQLGRVGFTFFEFLTVRPTFYGLIASEVRAATAYENPWIDYQILRWQSVDFFHFTVSPVLFTLLVQSFVIGSLFLVVHRKWRGEQNHPFSKRYAMFAALLVQVVLVGSLWPFVTKAEKFNLLFGPMAGALRVDSAVHALLLILFLLLLIAGIAGGALIQLTSPSLETVRQGWRRTRKLGGTRLAFDSDAATSLPVTLLVIALTSVSYGLILTAAQRHDLFDLQPTAWWVTWTPPVMFALLLLFMQFLGELASNRTFLFTLFVLWVIPIFVQVITLAAFDREVLAVYLGMPSPFTGLYLACARFAESASAEGQALHVLMDAWRAQVGTMIAVALSLYGALALAMGVGWAVRRRRLRERELLAMS